ncbi:MarR family winged helix-turn-helix transcriptional regulator [Phaeocystidibacter marisrubri]|uniref:MarR family transcriptional regulator n=1 Tax=Phaeocystidibacter marisrubri TaxID=1577780 RepID=A0A6L3ZHM9_9FLAO|nr:MarR family transcriptional regulator [Phaeocystidibacter marisrubri]KAB2817098.1 MarR family transcriptional regulator [Phaeocystidibacter marisrubri]GGH76871.1 MarR family transcriptional regulator [Phaeocystidibacter marisrubri]
MRPEETVDFHIKFTWQGIARWYNDYAAQFDTTMATGYVLLNVDQENGTPSTSLGPKMGMEPTSLSRLLKVMEERNLIRRAPHPEDGRVVLIFLTDFGIEQREHAKEAVLKFNRAVKEKVSKTDLNGFFRTMNKINILIEQLNEELHHEENHS